MLKNLALLIFIFIIAFFGNLTYAATPTIPFKWSRNELFGAFQDDAYQVGTFSNQSSLVERAVYICEPGYSQCPNSALCCSTQCSIICGDNSGCCPSGYGCCDDGQHCCQTGYKCCGIYCCDPDTSHCCSDKSGCCMLGYECAGNGLCSRPTLSPTITLITQEVVEYIVRYIRVIKWATENGYSNEEADELEETAEKLVECINNFGISLANSSVTNNDSCISCENIKSLSNIDIDLPPTNYEIIVILKLLYSLKEDIKDASECKFNLACMNGADSCSQNSPTNFPNLPSASGYNSNTAITNSIRCYSIISLL
ncbi:19527_t:CDS:2 [Dentiscutata erythropus]|uniref:19527_t:CDS:1 n=1 Tax=Dentiscutata erythropus TaxID=1348616 RepID=A0A9N9ENW1_9GLOM|nr:19527_t:CDS:2 [Dentiscutata erythropus]